jgi:glycopeptide antibiotics resistance protein
MFLQNLDTAKAPAKALLLKAVEAKGHEAPAIRFFNVKSVIQLSIVQGLLASTYTHLGELEPKIRAIFITTLGGLLLAILVTRLGEL